MESEPGNKKSATIFPRARALYVHVPFCRRKCSYCDFYSLAACPGQEGPYLEALAADLARHDGGLARPCRSVFVGGGTPTVLPARALGGLLALLRPYVGPATEFTVEANPGTITAALAAALVEGGVNRVSLGVQSFAADELAVLGRIHSRAQARRAFQLLRHAGVANLSIDLMYGTPGQTLESWRGSLTEATALGADHLSCYCLTLEPATPLGRDCRAGRIHEMDEALQRDCYDAAIDHAAAAGLKQYELSNFARPHRQCVHNLTYWHNEPYVGVGPGAAGYLDGRRWTNRANLEAWARALCAGHAPPARGERLTGRALMAETVMLALRLTRGLDRRAFARRFGSDVAEVFPRSIARHQAVGSLVVTPGRVRLAREYYFTSNAVLSDLVAEGAGEGQGKTTGGDTKQ
ncbi:MAG: radical SAM family heme chaperone HemW [Planctomycetota bacterium]|nr:radical SAM family heme chaperone HemW [Planctomycetota bacterium]